MLALSAAGAEVTAAVLYRSETVSAEEPALQRGLRALAAGEIEIATFFAPSQVRALFAIAGSRGLDARASLSACRVVAAIGETTAGALRERGVEVDLIPETPGAAAFAAALAAHAATR
ncbi:MAG: hypothetical protein Tsb0020_36810 [Haliangiales bacterium]